MESAELIEITLGEGEVYTGGKKEGFLDTVASVEASTFGRGTDFYRS